MSFLRCWTSHKRWYALQDDVLAWVFYASFSTMKWHFPSAYDFKTSLGYIQHPLLTSAIVNPMSTVGEVTYSVLTVTFSVINVKLYAKIIVTYDSQVILLMLNCLQIKDFTNRNFLQLPLRVSERYLSQPSVGSKWFQHFWMVQTLIGFQLFNCLWLPAVSESCWNDLEAVRLFCFADGG